MRYEARDLGTAHLMNLAERAAEGLDDVTIHDRRPNKTTVHCDAMYPITLHADTASELDEYIKRLHIEDKPDVSFSFGHYLTSDAKDDYGVHRFVTLTDEGDVVGIGQLITPDTWDALPEARRRITDGQKYVLVNNHGKTSLRPVVVGRKSHTETHPLR